MRVAQYQKIKIKSLSTIKQQMITNEYEDGIKNINTKSFKLYKHCTTPLTTQTNHPIHLNPSSPIPDNHSRDIRASYALEISQCRVLV